MTLKVYNGTIPLIIAIIATIIGIALITNVNKKKENAIRSRQEAIMGELSDHYYQLSYCPVGFEYTYPPILQQLKQIVQTGRADTLKEAINVMIDDNHKSNMETAAFLTAQNSYAAARSARVAAVAGTINLFKK